MVVYYYSTILYWYYVTARVFDLHCVCSCARRLCLFVDCLPTSKETALSLETAQRQLAGSSLSRDPPAGQQGRGTPVRRTDRPRRTRQMRSNEPHTHTPSPQTRTVNIEYLLRTEFWEWTFSEYFLLRKWRARPLARFFCLIFVLHSVLWRNKFFCVWCTIHQIFGCIYIYIYSLQFSEICFNFWKFSGKFTISWISIIYCTYFQKIIMDCEAWEVKHQEVHFFCFA